MSDKKISLNPNITGLMVYAKPKNGCSGEDWLLLISKIHRNDNGVNSIRTYISISLTFGDIYFSEKGEGNWGYDKDYDFYNPSESDRKRIVRTIANKGYKYIPTYKALVKKI